MRKTWWIFSSGVIVAAGLSVGAADDLTWGTATLPGQGSKPKIHYFSRSGSESVREVPATGEEPTVPQRYSRGTGKRILPTPSAADQQRAPSDYLSELVGSRNVEPAPQPADDNPFAAPGMSPSQRPATGASRNVPKPGRADVLNPFAAAEADQAAKPKPGTAIVPAAGSANAKSPLDVIHAAYDERPGSEGQIQQVNSSGAETAPRGRPAAERKGPALSAMDPAQIDSRLLGVQTPTVELQWIPRSDVNVGQECRCGLQVRNTGKVSVRDVVVEAFFPASVRLLDAKPYPAESQDRLVWNFAELPAGKEQLIEIAMIPSKRGELPTSATVRFTGAAAAIFKVEEPQLKLAVKGPQQVLVGETASQLVTVSNPGTGVAQDVIIQALVPEGLEHPNGKRLTMGIGSLAAGESREVRLALAAVGGGEQVLHIEARSGTANLVQSAETRVQVVAPSLELTASGPGLRYIDRNAKYTFKVTNNSQAATNNVRVVEAIPSGFSFVRASSGGQVDPSGRIVSWFVGRLEPGESATLEVELRAREMGRHIHEVRAVGDNGINLQARTETRVEGTASLIMEVADLDDPVEVGTDTAYAIQVRNDGSIAATNIAVSCELPPGVELVKGEGPTQVSVEEGVLVFKPLKELGPDQTAKYMVHIRGSESGNLRFRARLSSDSLQKPLIVEEVTKFYAD